MSSVAEKRIPLQKIVTLDAYGNKERFRKTLEDMGIMISDSAGSVIGAFSFPTTNRKINIKEVSVRELGFKSKTPYRDIVAKAKSMKLDLCGAEAIPSFCFWKISDSQAENNLWVHFATVPIRDSQGDFCILSLVRKSPKETPMIISTYGNPLHEFRPEHPFVFEEK